MPPQESLSSLMNIKYSMFKEYAKFMINGAIIGLLFWFFQLLIFKEFGMQSSLGYFISSAVVYPPMLLLNFYSQKFWVFGKNGNFKYFFFTNISIMAIVLISAPFFRLIINHIWGSPNGDFFGFACAAIFSSLPSFFIKRKFIFLGRIR
jgi:hypothetical protein